VTEYQDGDLYVYENILRGQVVWKREDGKWTRTPDSGMVAEDDFITEMLTDHKEDLNSILLRNGKVIASTENKA